MPYQNSERGTFMSSIELAGRRYIPLAALRSAPRDFGHELLGCGDRVVDAGPTWSPDGKRIAFVSDRDGNPEIYVMAAEGSDVRRLTNNPAVDASPSWWP